MRLFSRSPEEKRSQVITVTGLARQFVAMFGSGTGITVQRACQNAAVWACVRVKTSTASGLPIDAVRKEGARRVPVDPRPALLENPSAIVAPDVWRAQVFWSMFTDGNAFGRVTEMSARRLPQTIETLDPACVTERRVDDTGIPHVRVDNGPLEPLFPLGTVWHVPGEVVPAGTPFALSPVDYAAKSINTALAAEDFSHGFFADGGHPSGLIKSDDELTEEQAKAIKAAFLSATQGNRAPAVFGTGLEYEQIQTDPKDSQFIDLLRFEVENACRFFAVPPSMIYAAVSGQNVTYANVSQADLHYLKHSMDTPLVRLEGALTPCLPRPQFALINRGAFLRADSKARAEEHQLRLATKTRTVNEVRDLEDEPRFSDSKFDEPGIPGEPPAPLPPPEEQ